MRFQKVMWSSATIDGVSGYRILPYVLQRLFGGNERARRNDPMLRIKRVYEPPAREDGRRMLVERLWPRGMKKEALAADAWMKEVAPSGELRRWFAHEVDRWEEFRRKYRKELDANPSAWAPLVDLERHGNVTLLYSAHDPLHNGAVVLRDYLMERSAGHRGKRTRKARASKTATSRTLSARGRAHG
jgi:uncharacterized protein YeaO (DUF488 family)